VYTGFWWENQRKRDYLDNPDVLVGGRIVLEWIFRKCDVRIWTGSMWLRIGTGGGHCECSNEHSGSIKFVEFLY
jgi:hypothetical protein